MIRLVRGELVKTRTDRSLWIFLGAALVYAAAMLAYHTTNARAALHAPPPVIPAGMSAADADGVWQQWALNTNPLSWAATLYSAGSTLGWLFAMLLGILVVSREFRYRTAPSTFLLTGSRGLVIGAKFAAAALIAAGFWLLTTTLDLMAGFAFLHRQGLGSQLTHWPVIRAVLLNLVAYAALAVLGVALGLVVRHQTPLLATTIGGYLLGVPLAKAVFLAVSLLSEVSWINTASVGLPSAAADVMITGAQVPQSPPWWMGAAIVAGYATAAVLVGLVIGTRRDVVQNAFPAARGMVPTGGAEYFTRSRFEGAAAQG